jgi:uncharacterized protein (TIGR02001 family)
VAFSLAAESDYRFRGNSLSDGRPTAAAQLAYDDPSGLYLNAAALGVYRRDGADRLGYVANIGYTKRLSPRVSIDGGLVHSKYRSEDEDGGYYSSHYTEAYVGLNVSDFAGRLYYSPHYFEEDVSTLYAEAEAGFQPAPNWRLSAHAGALFYLRAPEGSGGAARYDWRLGVSRQWGALEVHAALSGSGPRGEHLHTGDTYRRTALTAGASLNF